MKSRTLIETIRQLIERDQVKDALDQTRRLLENSPLLDEVILQSSRFQHILKKERTGTVNFHQSQLTQNQIKSGLLELLREIEGQATREEIRTELENYASNKAHVQNADKIYNINKIDKADFY